MRWLNRRRFFLAALVICYWGAIISVVFGLARAQSHRYGTLAVEQITLRNNAERSPFLELRGVGFTSAVRAVIAAEPDGLHQQFTLDHQWGQGLWFDGQTLLTSSGRGLLVSMQVAADNTLHVLGSLRLPGRNIRHIIKVGSRALVSLGREGLWLVDLQNPEVPALMGPVNSSLTDVGFVTDTLVKGNQVFLADRQNRLLMIDFAAADPVLVSMPVRGRPWRLAIYQNRMVTGSLDGLVELYEFDAGRPRLVGEMRFDKSVFDVGLSENGLFVACENGELQTFDTASWPQPQSCSTVQLHVPILDLLVLPERQHLLVVRPLQGILPIDVSRLHLPEIGKTYHIAGTVRALAVNQDKLASISINALGVSSLGEVLSPFRSEPRVYGNLGFSIYPFGDKAYFLPGGSWRDSTDGPLQPIPVLLPVPDRVGGGSKPMPAARRPRPVKPGACLLVHEKEQGSLIHLFCQREGEIAPQWKTTLRFEDTVEALVHDRHFFVTERDLEAADKNSHDTLFVYDVVAPEHPRRITSFDVPGPTNALSWLDPHYLLVAAGQQGLLVVDVADPSQPRLAGQLKLPRHLSKLTQVVNVEVNGKIAYLAHQRSGVSQVDLRTPEEPRLLQMTNVPGYARTLTVKDGFLLVSLLKEGLFLVDVGSGGDWMPIGTMETLLSVYDVKTFQDQIFLSGKQAGIFTVPMPQRAPVQLQGRRHARVLLPDDLSPGTYRLYLYNQTENVRFDAAFQVTP